jgi:hypothetical protein
MKITQTAPDRAAPSSSAQSAFDSPALSWRHLLDARRRETSALGWPRPPSANSRAFGTAHVSLPPAAIFTSAPEFPRASSTRACHTDYWYIAFPGTHEADCLRKLAPPGDPYVSAAGQLLDGTAALTSTSLFPHLIRAGFRIPSSLTSTSSAN